MQPYSPLDAESKRMVAHTLDKFVQASCQLNDRRARLRQPVVDYRRHWPVLAELGVLALPVDPDRGGMSGSAVDVADAMRTLAPGLLIEPLVEAAVIAGSLLRDGPDASATAALGAAVAGDGITVLVGGRPHGIDALTAALEGGRWRLSGRASVVPFVAQADDWLIAATDADTATPIVFRLAREQAGAMLHPFRLMDGRPAGDAVFESASLPETAVWLHGATASAALDRAGLRAVSAYCADAVGVMQYLLDTTRDYLRTRIQFGVAIGTFQALQHRLATMHMAVSEASAIAAELATSVDEGTNEQRAWLRFAAASVVEQAAALVGHEAIQMHGGMGVTEELIVSHCNARLVVLVRMLRIWVPAEVVLPD